MWLVRNDALHHAEDSAACNAKRHDELKEEIDAIFENKPHDRLLPHADVAFFKNKKELSKKFKERKRTGYRMHIA